MGDAKINAVFDLDITNTAWGIDRWTAVIIQNPADALDQTQKRGLIQLIGSPEADVMRLVRLDNPDFMTSSAKPKQSSATAAGRGIIGGSGRMG